MPISKCPLLLPILFLLLCAIQSLAAEAGSLVDPLPGDEAGEPGEPSESEVKPGQPAKGPLIPPVEPSEDIYVQPPTLVSPGIFPGSGRLILPHTAEFITSEPGETRFKYGALVEHQIDYSFHPDGSGGVWSHYEEIRLEGSARLSDVAQIDLQWEGRNARHRHERKVFDPQAEPPGNIRYYDEVYHDFYNFYLFLNLGRLGVHAGRQNIDWGQGWMFNPINIFQRKDVFDPDEQLVGTDAVRTTSFLGRDGEFDLVLGLKDWDTFIGGANCRWGKENGSRLFGLTFAHDKLLGLTVAGGELALKSHLTGTALFLEAGVFFDREDEFDPHDYGAVDIGIEKLLPDDWQILVEYYHDGHGAVDPATYGDEEYYDLILGNRQVIGRNHVVVMLQKKVAGSRFRIYTLSNTDDRSTIIAPEYMWEPFPNVSLLFGASIVSGPPDSEFRPQGFRNIYDWFDRCTIYTRFKADF